MSKLNRIFLLAASVAAASCFPSGVQAQFDQATKWVPAGANVIALVREKDILESDLAKTNNWRSEATRRFKAGSALLPPSTERLLIASELDFEFNEPAWQVTVFENSKSTLNMIDVSKRVNGSIDTIAGNDALVLPGDAFLVKVDDSTLVSMYPANRQATSRWITKNQRGGSTLSPYLSQAVRFADNNAQVMIAFDLHEVISQDEIKKRMQETTLFGPDQVEAASEALASIQGMQFGITINDKINGAIKIDFDKSIAPIADQVKSVLIHALEKNGLMIEDFRDWTAKTSENQVVLSGLLSENGLRQVASYIEQPLVMDFAGEYGDDAGSDMKTRTLQYFTAVSDIVDTMRNKDTKALQTHARWMDKFAMQIDKLPVVNVDPDALKYGEYVSTSFRDISSDLLNAQYNTMVTRQSVPDEYSNTYYGYGGRYANYNTMNYYKNRDQQRATNQGQLQGQNRAKQQMDGVLKATLDARKDLSVKYQIEF